MSDRSAASPDPTATTRRTVLRAAGLTALAGGGVAVLGACGADGATDAPSGAAPSSSAPASSAPASSPAASPSSASPSASASASESVAVPEGPSVATSEVPVGSGVILDDADYVITQPTKGEFKAFSKICTHQRCPVTEVDGATIVCKCHNSQFSIEDGSVQGGPATKPLPPAEVEVAGDQVVVTA